MSAVATAPGIGLGSAPALADTLRRCPPAIARILAMTAMLTTLSLAGEWFDLDGASDGGLVGLELGVGTLLLFLPRWLGLPWKGWLAVVAILSLALVAYWRATPTTEGIIVLGLLMIGLRTTGFAVVAGVAAVVLLLAGFFILVRRGLPPIFTLVLLSIVAVLAMAAGFVFVADATLRVRDGWIGNYVPHLYAMLLWGVAIGAARLEIRTPFGAGRWLGAVRVALFRLVGAALGVVAALSLADGTAALAWRQFFATPLEGMAAGLGWLAGVATATLLLLAVFHLPPILARLQLRGRLAALALAETQWLLALAPVVALPLGFLLLGLLQAAAFLQGAPLGLEGFAPVPLMLALAASVLAYGAVRLILGLPAAPAGRPLWIFVPQFPRARGALERTRRLANAWKVGPATLVAPAATALQLHGPHQRLAALAGVLPRLFPRNQADGALWREATPEAGDALPARELYGQAAAWRSALAALPQEARCVVMLDPADGEAFINPTVRFRNPHDRARTVWALMSEAWFTDFFAALPRDRTHVVSGPVCGVPQILAGASETGLDWRHLFADQRGRDTRVARGPAGGLAWSLVPEAREFDRWLDEFCGTERSGPPGRWILVAGEADDLTLARQLAESLSGLRDAEGRRISASVLPLAVPLFDRGFLGMSLRTWGILARLAAREPEAPAASSLDRRTRWMLRAILPVTRGPIDLVVIESGNTDPTAARRFDNAAAFDHIIALVSPALDAVPETAARLHLPIERYSGSLHLPPASALSAHAVEEIARRIAEGRIDPPLAIALEPASSHPTSAA